MLSLISLVIVSTVVIINAPEASVSQDIATIKYYALSVLTYCATNFDYVRGADNDKLDETVESALQDEVTKAVEDHVDKDKEENEKKFEEEVEELVQAEKAAPPIRGY